MESSQSANNYEIIYTTPVEGILLAEAVHPEEMTVGGYLCAKLVTFQPQQVIRIDELPVEFATKDILDIQPKKGKSGYYGLYVADSHRNSGLGSKLIRNIVDYGFSNWGGKNLQLQIVSAEKSQGFYKRLGFVQQHEKGRNGFRAIFVKNFPREA
jgi:GNAT superfamily N-acetyltransferase